MFKCLVLAMIIFFVACTAGFATDMYLTGSINDKYPIFMYLSVRDKAVSGWYYYYQSQGGKINLKGEVTGEGGMTLAEEDQAGKITGHFTGKLAEGVFKGEWKNANKKFNFNLTSVAETMTSSLTKGEGFTSTNEFPFFTGSVRTMSLNKDIFQANQEQVTSFFNNCYKFFSDLKAEDKHIPAPWTSELAYTIEYYSDSVISILFSCYEYTGGAHGNTYYFVKNYKLGTSGFTPLLLADLVKSTNISSGLSALIIQDLKAQQASSVTDGDKQSFQPDELSTFTLGPNGITFHFAPYEVASYAEGAFDVFIPFEKLKTLLNKEMVTLLKLDS